MMRNHSLIAAMAAASIFSGCGGGGAAVTGGFTTGSSSTTTLAVSTAQGVYEGVASNGRYFNTLVLENDQYYTIYGNLFNNVFTVAGLITGTGQSGNGGFSSADLKDFTAGGVVLSGSLNASFTPGESFNAVVTESSSATSFAGIAFANTRYIYDTSASLGNIVGTWNMTLLGGMPASLTVAANGGLTGASDGCNFLGTIRSRASGKNVFDVTINFGAAPCVLANQTMTGNAVSYILIDGKRQLLVAASDAARSAVTVLAGGR